MKNRVLTAFEILAYQDHIIASSYIAKDYKAIGREFDARFRLTDREAITLLNSNDRKTREVLKLLISSENRTEVESRV